MIYFEFNKEILENDLMMIKLFKFAVFNSYVGIIVVVMEYLVINDICFILIWIWNEYKNRKYLILCLF